MSQTEVSVNTDKDVNGSERGHSGPSVFRVLLEHRNKIINLFVANWRGSEFRSPPGHPGKLWCARRTKGLRTNHHKSRGRAQRCCKKSLKLFCARFKDRLEINPIKRTSASTQTKRSIKVGYWVSGNSWKQERLCAAGYWRICSRHAERSHLV